MKRTFEVIIKKPKWSGCLEIYRDGSSFEKEREDAREKVEKILDSVDLAIEWPVFSDVYIGKLKDFKEYFPSDVKRGKRYKIIIEDI